MHEYPKVLRFDHELVPEEFWEDELKLTEKTDGTNIRFQLYESRFHEEYSSEVHDCEPEDGDIIFGTRRAVRGCVSSSIDTFNGALHEIVRMLRELDTEPIRHVHDEYGPVVWFAEGMRVYSSLDYNFTGKSEPNTPVLVGFDVYVPRKDTQDEISPNPFEQTFEGFLSTEKSFNLYEKIGITPTERADNIPTVAGEDFDVESYEFPESKFASITVEGIVLRNDSLEKRSRVKVVRDKFKEINREAFGWNEEDASNPEEKFLAIFCPNARIRKVARKYAEQQDTDIKRKHIDSVWRLVYEDIWKEEWAEIKELDFSFKPSEVKPLVAKRTAAVIERMVVTAEMNDVRPQDVW